MAAQTDKLVAHVNGIPAGYLSPSPDSPKYVFTYFADASSDAFVSLTMPVRAESYVWQEGLHPIFQMNLPEGYQKDLLRHHLGPSMPVDDFHLLAITGSRGIGRTKIFPWGKAPTKNAPAAASIELLAHPDSKAALLEALNTVGTENISGVMPKAIALPPDQKLTLPTEHWILKTGRQDTPGIAINEYLCLELAREMQLPVPKTLLSTDGQVIAVERFDRAGDEDIGLEDFCALMGLPPYKKYETTLEAIARHLKIHCAPSELMESSTRLIEMNVLNLVVRNADAHAKNYAMLYSSKENAILAPVYDVLTVSAYPDFAQSPYGLSIGGRKAWNLRKELERIAVEHLNLPKTVVADAVEKVSVAMVKVMPMIAQHVEEFPEFREIGKRMIRLWQEGFATTAGKAHPPLNIDMGSAKLSDEAPQPKRKDRTTKSTMYRPS